MSLTAGQRLGPYEILAPLGAGGMGEVYRAKDTRLDRQVALKVLPAEFASNAERRQRFEKEAKAIAALNHPNIVAVFDVGENYFVAELVDGASLRGAELSPRDCLDVAAQIADGLAAAHAAGIVHRDIKPDNILLTRDGRVKILDFGLAKSKPVLEPSDATLTLAASTDPGMVMGTVGYMSPEQVRGEEIDARSDIFSFGAVLYELIARKRAFTGQSAAEAMTAIAREDVAELPSEVSAGLRQIVAHCLEKNRDKRFQNARDLAFALRSLSGSGAQKLAVPTRRSFAGWIAAGAAAAAGGIGYFAGAQKKGAALRHQRLTFRRGFIDSACFTPDGAGVVYAANWEDKGFELYTTRLDSTVSASLGIAARSIHSISSQGKISLLLSAGSTGSDNSRLGVLATASLLGGKPREIVKEARYAQWTSDGKDLIVSRELGPKNQIEWPVGKIVYETANRISEIRLSPDGRLLAFAERPDGMLSSWRFAVLNQAGQKREIPGELLLEWLYFAWAGPDELWLEMGTYAGTTLYSLRLDGVRKPLAGMLASFRLLDVSPRGQALVSRRFWRVALLGILEGETAPVDFSWLDCSEVDDISPDGKTLLITEYGEGGGEEKWSVYVRKTDGSEAVRLGEGQACALSPDGTRALTLRRGARPQLVIVPLGAGNTVILETPGIEDARFGTWTPDGKSVVFDGYRKDEGWRLFMTDLATAKMRPITAVGERLELGQHTVSPDGRVVATMHEGGDLRLNPLGGGQQTKVSCSLPVEALSRFSADGRSLFGMLKKDRQTHIVRIELPSGRTTIWKTIQSADPAGVTHHYCTHVTRDERSYFYNTARILSDLYVIDGLRT